MTDDRGAPIAYTVLEEGTPVQTRDGVALGKVRSVRSDETADIFDGIVVNTGDGERFVEAARVEQLYERCVILDVDAGEAERLPEAELGPGETTGDHMRDAARRAWDRLSGNY